MKIACESIGFPIRNFEHDFEVFRNIAAAIATRINADSRAAVNGNQGGDCPPLDFGGKSWQVLNFCWQVLLNLKKVGRFSDPT